MYFTTDHNRLILTFLEVAGDKLRPVLHGSWLKGCVNTPSHVIISGKNGWRGDIQRHTLFHFDDIADTAAGNEKENIGFVFTGKPLIVRRYNGGGGIKLPFFLIDSGFDTLFLRREFYFSLRVINSKYGCKIKKKFAPVRIQDLDREFVDAFFDIFQFK